MEKISAISVTPAAVTQDLLDGITDAFFSNAKIYTADSYYVQTKDEIKKKNRRIKKKMLPTEIWILIIGEPMIMAISYMIFTMTLIIGKTSMNLHLRLEIW